MTKHQHTWSIAGVKGFKCLEKQECCGSRCFRHVKPGDKGYKEARSEYAQQGADEIFQMIDELGNGGKTRAQRG